MGIPLNIEWQQILLHLFNLAILTLGLYLLLYKPIKKFVKRREEYYLNLDEKATKKLEEAERTKNEYALRLENAEAEAGKKAAEQMNETEKAVAFQLDSAKKQSEKIIADARSAAKKEREKALERAKDEITQLAVTATEKLLAGDSCDLYEQFLSAADKEQSNE